MDEECESLNSTPDDPEKYSETLVMLLRKAYQRDVSKAIIRQLLFRVTSNCQRLVPRFGEDAIAAIKAKLEEEHEDLTVSHQPSMVSASGDFAAMHTRMMMRAANPTSLRALNPQPGLARNFMRQAEHDIAAAQNDNIGEERSGQWACFKLHQVNVSPVIIKILYRLVQNGEDYFVCERPEAAGLRDHAT